MAEELQRRNNSMKTLILKVEYPENNEPLRERLNKLLANVIIEMSKAGAELKVATMDEDHL